MKFQTKAKKGKITMKKYLAVTLCALSAAAVVTACAAGDRNDSDYKQGNYEESAPATTTRETAATSRKATSRTESSRRDDSSSRRDTSSKRRDNSSRRDDSNDVMSRVGEGIDDVISGGGEVIDDTLDTGREVVDDIFE